MYTDQLQAEKLLSSTMYVQTAFWSFLLHCQHAYDHFWFDVY